MSVNTFLVTIFFLRASNEPEHVPKFRGKVFSNPIIGVTQIRELEHV